MRMPYVCSRQRGSAVPFAVAAIGLLLMLGAGLGVIAAMFVAHRTAQAAADLAALAGAQEAARGGDACLAAAEFATANDTVLDNCVVDGSEVQVSVTASGPRWLGADADLRAEGRAGPAP